MKAFEHLSIIGHSASDKVTGMSGVITEVDYDLFGCIQAWIQPPAKDGKLPEKNRFDVNRLIIRECVMRKEFSLDAFRLHISNLGLKADDKISGFNGVITTVSFSSEGIEKIFYLLQPGECKEEYKTSVWFDSQRVIVSGSRVMNMPNYEWGVQAEAKQGANDVSRSIRA
jgi:hypothetical protein